MRPRKLNSSVCFALSNHDRSVVEKVAADHGLSLGEACRFLMSEGMKAQNLG